MTEWINLVGNTLWILGCAAALATVSHASWEASSHNERFLSLVRLPGYQIALALAGISFCLGMCGVAGSSSEAILWLIMAGVFAGYTGYLVFLVKSKR
jgi:hypothetical protein